MLCQPHCFCATNPQPCVAIGAMPCHLLDDANRLATCRQSADRWTSIGPGYDGASRSPAVVFSELRLSMVPEIALASGRRADLMALNGKGEIWIVEIKSSVEDLRSDRKWSDYRAHCDRLFFATHPGVPSELFPEDCGLIISDGWSADLLREAPEHRLAAASRKAVLLRFARAAADRLLQAELSASLTLSERYPNRSLTSGPRIRSSTGRPQRGARLARMRCSVRRCMFSRRAVSETLRSHIS
jgi:hypothetical protein